MKHETGHVHAGSHRRVRADATRRSTRQFVIALGASALAAPLASFAQLVGCNSREAYCTEQVRVDELNSLVGYGVAPNPPYKTKKVIEVGSGFVANLRRPGGNITGLTNINEALAGKRLEPLKELNPRMFRVAVLIDPAISAHSAMLKEARSSAQSLGFKVFAVDYRSTMSHSSQAHRPWSHPQ